MVSIAIPSSLVNASACYSLEQATYTLYQIARVCVHFHVSEIVVYESAEDAKTETAEPAVDQPKKIRLDDDSGNKPSESKPTLSSVDNALIFTANMLQYLITPVYLRKLIFKPFGRLQEFRYAKNLPQIPGLFKNKKVMLGIAMPRERKKRLPGQKKLTKKDRKDATLTPYINLGFDRLFKLQNDATVQTHSQVYIDLAKGESTKPPNASSDSTFSVRAVTKFSQIFTQSSIPDGYTQTIYTPTQQFKSNKVASPLVQNVDFSSLSKNNNEKLLLVFGTWPEVQDAVSKDEELELPDASALFDGIYKGCERVRLEDAVTVTLSKLLP